MADERLPIIPRDDALSPEGCGAGTENACFALGQDGVDGDMRCLRVDDSKLATLVGIELGWRLNIDPSDGKAWCPKGVLRNSKKSGQ